MINRTMKRIMPPMMGMAMTISCWEHSIPEHTEEVEMVVIVVIASAVFASVVSSSQEVTSSIHLTPEAVVEFVLSADKLNFSANLHSLWCF